MLQRAGLFSRYRVRGFQGVRIVLVSLLMLLSVAGFSAVQAAIITVTGDDGAIATDGVCSINEAIANANGAAQIHGECAAGSAGADTLILTDFIELAETISTTDGHNGTLSITSAITIDGQGFEIKRDTALPCTLNGIETPGIKGAAYN